MAKEPGDSPFFERLAQWECAPRALRAFLRRHYLWGCRTYDPSKAGKGRARARAEDEARIAGSLRLDDKLVAAYLSKARGLGKSEMAAFRRFRVMERGYAGRISCGTLYKAFGSQRRYQRFLGHGILRVTDEYSTGERKCRQWTLASGFVRAVRTLAASPWLRRAVAGGGGIVSSSQARIPDHYRCDLLGTATVLGCMPRITMGPSYVTESLPGRDPP